MLRQGCSGNTALFTLPAHDTIIEGPVVTVTSSSLHIPLHQIPWALNTTNPNIADLHDLLPQIPMTLQELTAQLQPLLSPERHPVPVTPWWVIVVAVAVPLLGLLLGGVGHWYVLRYARSRLQREA